MLSVRIADDVEKSRSLRAGYLRTVLDQRARNAATPHGWLHKQSIQFRASIGPGEHGSKSGDGAVALANEYRSGDDLFQGQLNRIGMGEQRIAIASVGEGCASLQGLEFFVLRDNRRANERVLHRLSSLPTANTLVLFAEGWGGRQQRTLLPYGKTYMRDRGCMKYGFRSTSCDGPAHSPWT
jgi:hypothetical protein